ncbi:flavin-containing monooxygenase [Amycolatopsis sp. NPDC003676]
MIEYYETVVVGGGFGGICAAHDLLAEGREDFVILERAAELGGVWRDNRYPNAACDVPAHFYSLSFAPNPTWTRSYAPWDEILAYINKVAEDLGIRDRVRFDTSLVSASCEEPAGVWNLRTAEGASLSCRFLIVASGSLSTPRIPDLPGRETFRGDVIHTAQWDDRISLAGRRVAVVGASASAAQVLPYAVDVAESVLAVIRTPPYVMPKDEQFYDLEAQARFRAEPARMAAIRSAAEHRFNVEAETQAVMDEANLAKLRRAVAGLPGVGDPRRGPARTPDPVVPVRLPPAGHVQHVLSHPRRPQNHCLVGRNRSDDRDRRHDQRRARLGRRRGRSRDRLHRDRHVRRDRVPR